MSEAADRRGERRLFVRIESHDDPVQGLDGDHALLARAAESEAPHVYLRLWWNAPCIVLGRGYAAGLPRRVDRVGELPVLVRGSGGQVVVHGPGVLQVSLAVPEAVWTGSIDEAFGLFAQGVVRGLVRLGFRPEVGEIPEAYCPGRYDVAIAGRKIMGISQRRTRRALLVHGALNVAVAPEWLADHLEAFYAAAGVPGGPQRKWITSLHETQSGARDAAYAASAGGERPAAEQSRIEPSAVERAIIEGMREVCEETLGGRCTIRMEGNE